MLLDSIKYVNFDTPHLASLKWNKQRTRPRLTMRDGTEYEITVPGKTVDDLKNITLGDWKKIAEELNRILIDKGILDAGEQAPVNARALDQLMVNKSGVIWNGNSIKHDEGNDTKARFKTIKELSKNVIKSTGLVPPPPAPPAPGQPPAPGVPGQPGQPPAPQQPVGAAANYQAAIQALGKAAGAQKDSIIQGINEDIDDITAASMNGAAIDWADLAYNLSYNNEKADAIYDTHQANIPNNNKADVQQKIRAVYVAKAVETVMNAVPTEARRAIQATRNWKTLGKDEVVNKCYEDLRPVFEQYTLEDGPIKEPLSQKLTEGAIKRIIGTHLAQLLAIEAARPKGQYEDYWNKAKATAGGVKATVNWLSSMWNGDE